MRTPFLAHSSGVARGGQGGHGPRAQALEGAPAQLIGANFKKKIRPRQIIKVTSLQCRINLPAKVAYAMGPALSRPRAPYGGLSFLFLAEDLFFSFFFFFGLSIFFPGADAGFTKRRGGGGHPEPQRRQPCRPMWQGGC